MHMLLKKDFDCDPIARNGGRFKQLQRLGQLRPWHKRFMRFHDARVRGGLGLVANQQFFMQLFTRTHSDDGNFNVASRAGSVAHRAAAELDHAPRQRHNFHRLAHIEHKHVTPHRHGAGLQHQLRRLRDRHEVARHLAVRHGQWPAGGQLPAKQRHHTAA